LGLLLISDITFANLDVFEMPINQEASRNICVDDHGFDIQGMGVFDFIPTIIGNEFMML
jgi:hypothetical protein